MAEARLNIEITAQVNEALGRLGAVEDKLSDLGKAVQGSNLGQSLNQIGNGATALGQRLTSSLGAIGTSIIQTAGNFESSMNGVVAVTNAVGEDFEKLRNQAKELGATTAFSASEAAEGMQFLGMAGFDTNEILTALPQTLSLASAGQIDLARSADIASNVLGGFQIKAEEMGRVSDVLAETARSANTSILMLGESFSYAGPVAQSFGADIEETSAVLGALGNVGIQGGRAGTTLATSMSRLMKPVANAEKILAKLNIQTEDGQGNFRDFTDILNDFAQSTASGADVLTVFGEEAGRGMLSLIEGIRSGNVDLDEFEAKLNNSAGAAQEMANIRMRGFAGQMKELQSAFEGLQIAIAETGLLENITMLVGKLTTFTSNLAQANPALLKFGVAIGAIAFTVGAILIPLGMVISSIGTLATLFSSGALLSAAPTFTAIAVAIWGAVSPVLAFVGTIGLVVAALASVAVGIPVLIGGFALLVSRILAVGASIVGAIEEFFGFPPVVSSALSQVSANLNNFAGKMFSFGLKIIGGIADGVKAGVSKLTGAFQFVFDKVSAFMPGSDAKRGPLSNLTSWGQAIPQTMAQGIQQGQSGLQRQLATTLAPAATPYNTSNINTPINMTNNINVNGSMNDSDKRDLMAELDAKGRDLVRMIERVTKDNNRTKYA